MCFGALTHRELVTHAHIEMLHTLTLSCGNTLLFISISRHRPGLHDELPYLPICVGALFGCISSSQLLFWAEFIRGSVGIDVVGWCLSHLGNHGLDKATCFKFILTHARMQQTKHTQTYLKVVNCLLIVASVSLHSLSRVISLSV